MSGPPVSFFCERAWLGGPVTERDVLVKVRGARVEAVEVGATAPAQATRLAGLTLPGFANTHSHAFHRALRGQASTGPGDFWAWRQAMYSVAEKLTPAAYLGLATAVFAEMALAGVTAVGEFHYLHHGPGGARYRDPNEMSKAVLTAAAAAGVRITLIDACYLESSPGAPPEGPQARFSDGSAEDWAERLEALGGPGPAGLAGPGHGQGDSIPVARVGAAVHSVRAVPPSGIALVAGYARGKGIPLHFHLSEQVRENEIARGAYGLTPAQVLAQAGAFDVPATAVHATHLAPGDISLLGRSRTSVCMCPTTEQDLADGIGPARALASAGTPLSLGTDSHASVDPFFEMRALEYNERLGSGVRGNWSAAQLLEAATAAGHAALGWPGAGAISPGSVADLVSVDIGSARWAAAEENLLELAVFAGCGADVHHVVNAGRTVVAGGQHLLVEDVPGSLRKAMRDLVP